MPYVAGDGSVLQRKPFGVPLIMDYVWGVVNFVTLFFRGLFHMDDEGPARGQYGNARHRVPGRSRIGGFRPSGGAAPPPCVGGG